jgi:hypothetical protein
MEPEADIESNEPEKSEIIYIRELALEPKRNICLAKKMKI